MARLQLQARDRLSATAGRGGRGGLRAAGGAGRGRRDHPRPRQIPARDRRFEEPADREARGALRQAGQMRGVGRRGRQRRGNRHHQHLLGADAGDDPRGRGARRRAGVGAGRRQCLPALAAAVQGDRRGRRQMPLDRRRVDHRQGHPRPDDGGAMRATIPATAGRPTAAMARPSISARFARKGRRRCTAAASLRCGQIEAARAQPELAIIEILGSESFESHPPAVESAPGT